MCVRMSCDVMLFFEWFYDLRVIQNRSQNYLKLLPNLSKIVSEALRSDKWRPEALKSDFRQC